MKFRERKKEERKTRKLNSWQKTKERQRKVTSRAKHKLHTKNSKKDPPEQMQAPPEHVDANFQILAQLFWICIKLTSSPPCWQCKNQGENAGM
jgi:hypothetical protein